MPITQVNGVGIHYERAGQGPDVVLVHGLAANMAFWYLAAFPALRRDFRVTAYDLRGHGRSTMPASGYASADMATDLAGLLAHLAVNRAHLVGHSFGAAVAVHLAILQPERVASLTLADPVIPALLPGERPETLGLEMLEELGTVGLSGTTPTRMPSGPFSASRAGNQTAALWQRLLADTTARADFRSLAGMTRAEMRGLRQPALAVFGGRSRWLQTRPALEEALPLTRFVVLPEVGHFHPLVKPRTFVRILRDFLANQERA